MELCNKESSKYETMKFDILNASYLLCIELHRKSTIVFKNFDLTLSLIIIENWIINGIYTPSPYKMSTHVKCEISWVALKKPFVFAPWACNTCLGTWSYQIVQLTKWGDGNPQARLDLHTSYDCWSKYQTFDIEPWKCSNLKLWLAFIPLVSQLFVFFFSKNN
jgi:hypothetical protein